MMELFVISGIILALVGWWYFWPTTYREFTIEELNTYDGKNGLVYIGCAGLVFDVSSSESYKPTGPYHMLSGSDCSVALAKMRMEEELLNSKAPLTAKEQKTLDEWKTYMEKKYKIVGTISN